MMRMMHVLSEHLRPYTWSMMACTVASRPEGTVTAKSASASPWPTNLTLYVLLCAMTSRARGERGPGSGTATSGAAALWAQALAAGALPGTTGSAKTREGGARVRVCAREARRRRASAATTPYQSARGTNSRWIEGSTACRGTALLAIWKPLRGQRMVGLVLVRTMCVPLAR